MQSTSFNLIPTMEQKNAKEKKEKKKKGRTVLIILRQKKLYVKLW